MPFTPLYDRVLLRRQEEQTTSPGGIVLPGASKEKSNTGTIVATGVYLSRAQLAQKLGIALASEDKPRIKLGGSCCNPKSGCC